LHFQLAPRWFHQLLQILGLVSQGLADAILGLLGLFVDQDRQLKELAVQGLLYLLWSAPGPAAQCWQYQLVAVLHY
jgi:hypothetical protein